eukprot:g25239.t1
MPVKQLSETLINQIAAGEVIERPASATKELIENAVDAGATRIEIATASGGKSLIRVTDNGCGMDAADLELAVRRHCTSKIDASLEDIRTLGFRGEALPSIGSVAKLTITSRRPGEQQGAQVAVIGGQATAPKPAPANPGTVVEVRDLFFATPARLKFMKTERAEAAAITEVVKRMAIAFPNVRFVLSGSDRSTLEFPATGGDHLARMAQVLGSDFQDNSIRVDAEREDVGLSGFIGVPTFHRGNSGHQYAFVNGRPVQDKLILSAIRGAYAETMPSGRYPVAVLSLTLDPALVDVNVHPAKADVRQEGFGEGEQSGFSGLAVPTARADSIPESTAVGAETASGGHRLGAARAQVHENYIVAQTEDGLVIVDQHAAHERLVYESLRKALDSNRLPSQVLLIPDIVDLPEEDCDRLMSCAADLDRLGLSIERFGPGAVAVRETPAMLGEVDAGALVRDLADEIAEWSTANGLRNKLEYVAATMACHGSVRSGRRLKPDEMNALLRQMEATPGSGTCNHGRPTYIELKLGDIERLFGRS